MRHPLSLPRQQRGVALVVGLIFLLVITTLTLASSRSTLLQERMVGNVRESNLAFQAAEGVLREVEGLLRVAAETATTQGLDLEPWTASGLEIFDCSGAEILAAADPSTWTVASTKTELGVADARYRLIQMSNVSGRAVACKPLEEEPLVGAGNRSSYYLILAYAEGPTGRGNQLVTSTYYYED